MKHPSIFVQVASYCDQELVPTLQDALGNAAHPDRLNIGVCWQHKPEDRSMDSLRANPQIKVDDVLDSDSQGCCWARSRVQGMYDGEDFTLQIDSHHKFEPAWDETLIQMMRQTEAPKPIITAYAGSYDLEKGKHACVPWKMKPKEAFGPDGALLCVPVKIPGWEQLNSPIPARFVSGHFLFTHGSWCHEVPYDPLLQFHGEEPTLSARSFTHGYDLFHPHRIVLWHRYTRDGRPRHWDDYPKLHQERDRVSKSRVRQLMGMEEGEHDLTKHGFGNVRTLSDYERFSGLDFKRRRIHQDCFDGIDPPCATDERWTRQHKVLIHWKHDQIVIPEDCTHVAYFVDDAQGKMLWHKDSKKEEDFQPPQAAEFCASREPDALVVWPHTAKGPGKKYVMKLRQECLYVT